MFLLLFLKSLSGQAKLFQVATFYCNHRNIYLPAVNRQGHFGCGLEPVCCKKRPKNSSLPATCLETKGPLKVLNGTKLILDDHGNNLDSFRISLESLRSFRGPLLLKPVTGQELFLAVSYSKPALVQIYLWLPHLFQNCYLPMYKNQIFNAIMHTTVSLSLQLPELLPKSILMSKIKAEVNQTKSES